MSKREKVLEEKRASRRPPVVHGDRRRHRRQCYHPRQPATTTNHDNNDIFRSVSVPYPRYLYETSYLRGVYCECDKGDLSIFAEGVWK